MISLLVIVVSALMITVIVVIINSSKNNMHLKTMIMIITMSYIKTAMTAHASASHSYLSLVLSIFTLLLIPKSVSWSSYLV